MTDRIRGNEYRYFNVCIDNVNGRVMSGSLSNPYVVGGESFTGLMDLLLRIDSLLNEMDSVRQGMTIRSFTRNSAPDVRNGSSDAPETGRLATFVIRILFRQNASWQGTVTWLEGEAEESFRSILELSYLMNSALSAAA